MAKNPKIGRPSISAEQRRKAALGFRPTPDIRQRLEQATAVNFRSLSAEIESRLEMSFAKDDAEGKIWRDTETLGIMRALAAAAGAISGATKKNWLDSQTTFRSCRVAFDAILDAMEPRGSGTSKVSPGMGELHAIAVLQKYVHNLGDMWGIDTGDDNAELRAAQDRIQAMLSEK